MSTAVSPAVGDASVPEAVYRARREAFQAEERRHARRSFRLSIARFAVFLAGAACLFMMILEARSPRPLWLIGAGLALVAFIALIGFHDRVIRRERRARDLAEINAEGLARMARDWPSLPLPAHPPQADPAAGKLPPLARDLGLFGRISLFHLLGTVHTPPGKAALATWLLSPAPPEEVAARQPAVVELTADLDFRQELEQRVRGMEKVPPDPEIFLRWAEEPPWLLARRGLVWASRLLPVLTLLLLAGAIARVLPVWPVLLAVAVNLILTHSQGERLETTFNRVTAREEEFQLYARALELLAEHRFNAGRLQTVTQALATSGRPAHAWMDLLNRRIVLSDTRRTAFSFLFQSLLLWDFHMVYLLERWKAEAGTQARTWLAALGDLEALAALAALAHAEPGWAYPTVRPSEPPLYQATNLAHPLLAAATRVGNDVTLGPPGTFLLVTGSNMSGKSTLLRSIGANAVLAQAGAPVCAAALTLPPVALATSVLVEDSLADGVSFFLAELHRVRQVVDAADRAAAENRTLLYLLDEVMRGTNSYERQVAVRRVLLHLLARNAIGAISTHDLQLAEVEDLRAACHPVHFRESYAAAPEGARMTFDYRLRPGVATTTNALKLLELVGLGAEPAPENAGR